ncbi:UNVERIFIED_CONTAM: putative mitochondrial protein [Sesamum latifolium]|uniref:Mitochondrial protein n=1 Tax=Sesamum latifolium TaxID=2727402 RepID=A0AAW2UHJ4_9LAMI
MKICMFLVAYALSLLLNLTKISSSPVVPATTSTSTPSTAISSPTSSPSTHAPLPEPKSYIQTQRREEWERAMEEELQALKQNETWTLTLLPKGKKAIGSRWVYKLKLIPDESVNRYKARLVAKAIVRLRASTTHKVFHQWQRMLQMAHANPYLLLFLLVSNSTEILVLIFRNLTSFGV